MSKHVTHRLTYDAPAGEVYRMLITPAFREQVGARMKVISVFATVAEADGMTEVTIDQVQPAKGLPSFATRLVGESIQIVQTERWTSHEHADLEVLIPGKPGEMSGTTDLEESDGVTTQVVEMDIKVRIPLVGGKLESLVVDMFLAALKTEHKVGIDYLAR